MVRRLSHTLSAMLATALVAAASSGAWAEQAAPGADPSPEYLQQKAQLEEMLTKRNLEIFEVSFDPLAFDRIVINDRQGRAHLYHYLAFRIRNQMGNSGLIPYEAKGYNEVLQTVAAQYEQAKVDMENGATLRVETAVPKDGIVVERPKTRTNTRSLALSVLAHDERGSRIRLLDDPIGSGPQENFAFPDQGDPQVAISIGMVRDRIEEALHRQLLTSDEIRARQLPPYDATTTTDEGWSTGEVYGVFVFDRVSDYAKRISVQVRGLTNKFRTHFGTTEPGKVENYLDAQFLRRLYVLEYAYPGDEFYRDQDRFTQVKAGFEWVPTFQRNAQRRSMAYARYYLDNITKDGSDNLNKAVEEEFWADYDKSRALRGEKLPDLKAELQ